MLQDELAHLIDGTDAIQIAFPLRMAPSEQAVTRENQPVASRMVLDSLLQQKRQLETRTLPRQPGDSPVKGSVELLHFTLPVRACRESDRPVRMQVIHVSKRQKGVERRVDR